MAETVRVEVQRQGRHFEAQAEMRLRVSLREVWRTLTDYAALPRYMPGIRACRVLEQRTPARGREELLLEQHGEFRFLLFAQAMTVRLRVQHEPMRLAQARAEHIELGVLGQRAVDVFEGRYTLLSAPGSSRARPLTVLQYTARIGLLLPPPPGIGNLAVRQNLGTQMQALHDEILRRDAAPGGRDGG